MDEGVYPTTQIIRVRKSFKSKESTTKGILSIFIIFRSNIFTYRTSFDSTALLAQPKNQANKKVPFMNCATATRVRMYLATVVLRRLTPFQKKIVCGTILVKNGKQK